MPRTALNKPNHLGTQQPYSSFPIATDEAEALAFLLPISREYPGIENWFRSKVVPGLKNGSRHLVRVHREGRLVALGIGKKELGENKICTVRVAPDFIGRGLGLRIFGSLMDWMGSDQPLATVSEDRLPEFEQIFSYFGFRLTSTANGLYRPGKTEYLFNEPRNPWS